jgi:hypothetical protein
MEPSPNNSNRRRIIHVWHLCISIIICLRLHLGHGITDATAATNDEFFTRFDRDAYLAARRGGKPGESDGADDHQYPANYDDPNKCTLYLSPSSIPNSGLGMYTTIPYTRGDKFFPEIGILFHDKHKAIIEERKRLSEQYPWQPSALSFGAFEARVVESYIPGIGMLVNSHLGLVNARLSEPWMMQRSMDGTDSYYQMDSLTMEDVGRGAQTTHGHVMFEAVANIEAGEELFVSYGDEWFTSREATLGIIPLGADFRDADELLRTFLNMPTDPLLGEDVEAERNGEQNTDLSHRSAEYEELLRNAAEKSQRLRVALPDNVQDVPLALQIGTARFSAKDSIQSLEWLEENGACLDNIVSGVSRIPQAGRGAFATRSIKEGGLITTTPVITFDREELLQWETLEDVIMDDGGMTMELRGTQLLFNYCYGHTDSSLLLFPYAPSVNFINHGSVEDSNAEIRWSTSPYHKAEWLDDTLDDMKRRMKTGLMFDIIATRDIHRGDEILLYYGKDWESAWSEHIMEWSTSTHFVDNDDEIYLPIHNLTDRLGLPTATNLNVIEKTPIVRTVEEQAYDPYPAYIMTLCQFEPPEECPARYGIDGPCVSRWRNIHGEKHIYPCNVLSRQFDSSSGMDWYTAQVEVAETDIHLVEYMSRHAILFSDRPYSKDQYARGIFRQFIGLPDGVMPSHWMDLNSTSNMY